MNQTQYTQFLNDPAVFMNNGPVGRLRINIVPATSNTISRTANYPGAVPVYYQFSNSLVTPVFLRYDNTGMVPTSALWAQLTPPAGGNFVRDRAYYLKWNADEAYVIQLGFEAQLFLTAQVDGCGIIVLEAPSGLTIIHHNIQVAAVGQTFIQRLFESQQDYNQRDNENRFDVRAQALAALVSNVTAEDPTITGGTALDVRQYMSAGSAATVFGVKRDGYWRIYVNHNSGGAWHTDLLYG